MNFRQEQRLEAIERLLADIRDLLAGEALRSDANADHPPAPSRPPYRAGLRDLSVASNAHSAELERDRRDAERANGWSPDSELSWQVQYERLSRQTSEYDRLVDEAYGVGASLKLPWNERRDGAKDEGIRPIARPLEQRPGPIPRRRNENELP